MSGRYVSSKVLTSARHVTKPICLFLTVWGWPITNWIEVDYGNSWWPSRCEWIVPGTDEASP